MNDIVIELGPVGNVGLCLQRMGVSYPRSIQNCRYEMRTTGGYGGALIRHHLFDLQEGRAWPSVRGDAREMALLHQRCVALNEAQGEWFGHNTDWRYIAPCGCRVTLLAESGHESHAIHPCDEHRSLSQLDARKAAASEAKERLKRLREMS